MELFNFIILSVLSIVLCITISVFLYKIKFIKYEEEAVATLAISMIPFANVVVIVTISAIICINKAAEKIFSLITAEERKKFNDRFPPRDYLD